MSEAIRLLEALTDFVGDDPQFPEYDRATSSEIGQWVVDNSDAIKNAIATADDYRELTALRALVPIAKDLSGWLKRVKKTSSVQREVKQLDLALTKLASAQDVLKRPILIIGRSVRAVADEAPHGPKHAARLIEIAAELDELAAYGTCRHCHCDVPPECNCCTRCADERSP